MAKYRALAKLYVAAKPGDQPRLVSTGEYFDSDDVPGSKWEPVDDDAKKRVAENPPRPGPGQPAALKPLPEQEADADAAPGPKGKGQRGTVEASRDTPSPGKSVARQQTDGEEPTQRK